MAKRTMQSFRRDNNTNSRDRVKIASDGSSPLVGYQSNNTRLKNLKNQEIVDLAEEEEEQGDNEDENSERDRVTETWKAESEFGKQPVFHHEIYRRLVNLMSSQGAYSMFLPNRFTSKDALTLS